MKNKRLLIVVLILAVVIGSISFYSHYRRIEDDLHTKVKNDLTRMALLVQQNLSLLDAYYEGDNYVFENIIYNHMVIRDHLLENEKLNLFQIEHSIITKSYELLDIRSQYLDELSRDDNTTRAFMVSYYNALLNDIQALNKDEISIDDIKVFLENGSTHLVFE